MELNDKQIERARLYELFSSLFIKQPTEEVLVQLREMFEMKFDDSPGEVAMDFGTLFLNPAAHLSPHESLYNYSLEETPKLWGKVTEEVQAIYRSVGLTVDEEAALIPDHIAMELLFMSYLVGNGLVEQQRTFMEDHLFQWVPDYCDEVEKHAHTMFYREVAVVLREFVLSDHEELAEES